MPGRAKPNLTDGQHVLRDIGEGLTADQTIKVLNVSQTAVKARLLRARLQLRESLSKYFSKQTHLARVQLFSSGSRTGRMLRPFGRVLAQRPTSRSHSISVVESDMHAATTMAATQHGDRCINHV